LERPSSESSSESSEPESEESEEEEDEEDEEEDVDSDEDSLTGFFPGVALLGGAALAGVFAGPDAPFSVFVGADVGSGAAAQESDSSEHSTIVHIRLGFSSSEELSQSLFTSAAGAGDFASFSSPLSASQSPLVSAGFSSGVGGEGSGSGGRAFVVTDGVDIGVDSFVEVPV